MLRIGLQFFGEGGADGGAEGVSASGSEAGIGEGDLFLAEMEQKYGITDGVASAQAMEAVRGRGSDADSQKAEGEIGKEKSEQSDNGSAGEAKSEGAENATPSGEKTAEEEFEELIKSDKYKGIYGQRVASAVSQRFKNQTDARAEADKYKGALSLLASRYGKDEGDVEGIIAAMSSDDELYEAEAMEKGTSVTEIREEKKANAEREKSARELSELKAQLKARESRDALIKAYGGWKNEAKETAKLYNGFDLDKELQNPDFQKYLMRDKMSVTDAYEHAHLKEIMQSQLRAVEKRADERILEKYKSVIPTLEKMHGLSGMAAEIES